MKKICYTLVWVLVFTSAPVAAMERTNPWKEVTSSRVKSSGLRQALGASEAARDLLACQNKAKDDQIAALTAQNADLIKRLKALEAVQNAALQQVFDAVRAEWAAVESNNENS